jgi:uncharacterized paraquat-inducible protein A
VRGRIILAVALLGAGLACALLARLTLAGALDPVAGLLVLAAVAAGMSALPLWARLRAPPMPGLFQRPRADQRWCQICGRPAPAGPCPRCHTEGRRGRREGRRRQRERDAPAAGTKR